MRTSIVGLGRMGRLHLAVAKELGLEVVGVCDANKDALESLGGGEAPDGGRFRRAADMLRATRPECLIVSTTADFHCELVCLAAEFGARYVLCEKPLAVSLEQCDSMIAACDANGTRLAVNHQMRFMEQYTEPKRLLVSDDLGGLSSVSVVAGNFGLAMNGTHYFEMFRFMTDERPRHVTAWLSSERVPNPRGARFEDRAGTVRIATERGRRFYLDASADQGHGIKVVYGARHGQILVDELAGAMTIWTRDGASRALPTTRYGASGMMRVISIPPAELAGPTTAVLRALLEGRGYPNGDDGRLAVAVLVAAYVSNENGNISVDIEGDNLPRQRKFAWA